MPLSAKTSFYARRRSSRVDPFSAPNYEWLRMFAWLICQYNLSEFTGCAGIKFPWIIWKTLTNQQIVKNFNVMGFTKGKLMWKLLVALLLLPAIALSDDKSAPASGPAQAIQTQPVSTASPSDRHYVNCDGALVQSPGKSTSGQVPAGASAKCGDGSYCFSKHRSATFSHQGGVAT